jgi:hypothetical protein
MGSRSDQIPEMAIACDRPLSGQWARVLLVCCLFTVSSCAVPSASATCKKLLTSRMRKIFYYSYFAISREAFARRVFYLLFYCYKSRGFCTTLQYVSDYFMSSSSTLVSTGCGMCGELHELSIE